MYILFCTTIFKFYIYKETKYYYCALVTIFFFIHSVYAYFISLFFFTKKRKTTAYTFSTTIIKLKYYLLQIFVSLYEPNNLPCVRVLFNPYFLYIYVHIIHILFIYIYLCTINIKIIKQNICIYIKLTHITLFLIFLYI